MIKDGSVALVKVDPVEQGLAGDEAHVILDKQVGNIRRVVAGSSVEGDKSVRGGP